MPNSNAEELRSFSGRQVLVRIGHCASPGYTCDIALLRGCGQLARTPPIRIATEGPMWPNAGSRTGSDRVARFAAEWLVLCLCGHSKMRGTR